MALKPLLSFSGGELDPVLHDNVTLERFNKGLSTARNVIIGKTGSITSRYSRKHLVNAKEEGRKIKIFSPPNSNLFLEWGHEYVRIYQIEPFKLVQELAHNWTESDLDNIHFVASGPNGKVGSSYYECVVYAFCKGKETKVLPIYNPDASMFNSFNSGFFTIPPAPTSITVTGFGTPNGYTVEYMATVVVNGQESLPVVTTTGYPRPNAAGQSNTITVGLTLAQYLDWGSTSISEVRIYQRPFGGGAFGLLGTTTEFFTPSSGLRDALYIDLGSLPDYTNGEQLLVTNEGLNGVAAADFKSKTGVVYQQRLIVNPERDEEALVASRPGYHNNFFRDFPYAPDSALHFKSGSTGKAKVLRMIEQDGLIVFTTVGVYVSVGVLSVNNLALDRRGPWVIKEDIPPLVVPGGTFFVDQNNAVRQLIFSQEIMAYESTESSIFSNHLFEERTIKSWSFQDGIFPIINVTFSDGKTATFTYNYEHKMKAWTRGESAIYVEQVEGTNTPDTSLFVVNKNGNRQIEISIPRKIKVDIKLQDEFIDLKKETFFMDSMKDKFFEIDAAYVNELGEGTTQNVLTPVVAGDWSGLLELTIEPYFSGMPDFYGMFLDSDADSGAGDFCEVGQEWRMCEYNLGKPGAVMRWFNPETFESIDLEVVSRINTSKVIVQPTAEFPEEYASNARLWIIFSEIDGLDHLEGEKVSVVVDGSVVASPYNDKEDYPVITVTDGKITLPEGCEGSFVAVGRPIVADIETLNVSTVEQSPTLLESVNLEKVYININKTKGLYIADQFPENRAGLKDGTGVKGMEDLDKKYVTTGNDELYFSYEPPVSKRIERVIGGNWKSQGRLSIRQVDPYHFEILSIIPDLTVLKRGR